MITKNQQNSTKDFLAETSIEVPAVSPNGESPSITQPTPYDYLTILPAILTAATPLILGLAAKSDFFRKQNSKQQSTENNDVSKN